MYRAAGPLILGRLALHLIAHREAQRLPPHLEALGRGEAVVEGLRQLLCVEVLPYEDHLALARLVLAPRLGKGTFERHVHSVVDEALLGVRDR
eukprot:scaffold98510_cov63-Phaeocystis_antarctica.AAC.3